jgi:thioredoxin-like negative regulator of GroEL
VAAFCFWSYSGIKCRSLEAQIECAIEAKEIALSKIDGSARKDLALRHSVFSLPTVIFFRDGQELFRLTGANISAARIEETCEKLLNLG